MKCIIVDDEPLARSTIKRLITRIPELSFAGEFASPDNVGDYLQNHDVDLIFLDIEMPNINGIEFAKTIPQNTLVVFTTAYPQYALDSYDVDAIDYLVKPIEFARFQKAVNKAFSYHSLLMDKAKENISTIESEYIFIKSDRRFFKVNFSDILFIEGLKDYVIIHTDNKKIITRMYLKIIQEKLPENFLRINKSYIVNTKQIESFDNNDVFIGNYEIAIGNNYRDTFFSDFARKLS